MATVGKALIFCGYRVHSANQFDLSLGRVSNVDHNKIPVGSATRKRELGYRPRSGLWQRKTGRHGRKIRRLPPMRVVTGPPKPQQEVIKLTESTLALRYNNY